MKTVFDPKRRQNIPTGIARLAAGRDSYLRKLRTTCDDCGAVYEVGDSDGDNCCQDCYEAAGEEIARLDRE